MILVISHRDDPHVAMVGEHLDSWGARWSFVPTVELGTTVSVTWALDPAVGGSITVDHSTVSLNGVSAVWNRRLLRPWIDRHRADPLLHQYVAEQWWYAMEGVLRGAADAHWVNPPSALEAVRSKPQQLVDAARVGLTVPPTLVTADVQAVRDFADELANAVLVTKVVSPGTPIVDDPADQYMVFTQRVRVTELDPGAVAAAPAMYQPELPKAYEVRATVVGDAVLGCRIDSMASEKTSLDWRHYDFERVAHEPVEVPRPVAKAVLTLCRQYGLRFGAVDFVVQPDGQWIFLELNGNGQWAWIEERSGLSISAHIASELSSPP